MSYSFENLVVWQKSRVFVKSVYILTSKFPPEEKFGIISQLRRASVSVSSNIAEGSVRWSAKEKARYYEIAYGSLIEVLNQLILSTDLNFMTSKSLAETRPQIDEISKMLSTMYKKLK